MSHLRFQIFWDIFWSALRGVSIFLVLLKDFNGLPLRDDVDGLAHDPLGHVSPGQFLAPFSLHGVVGEHLELGVVVQGGVEERVSEMNSEFKGICFLKVDNTFLRLY